MGSILSLLSMSFGCFGFLPLLFAGAALIDAFRVRADWYWFMIILAFPIVGSIVYFVVVRSPLLSGRSAAMMSPTAARRLQARRRLRVLQVQLSHWRGPAVLAEAGEELVVLGKPQEAEAHLRESRDNGGAVEDVNLPLAQALEMQGRWAEAVPLLEELCKAEPDARLGQGPLHLGRCLDEAGRKDEAEAVLRKVLERRTVIEAQVRLARILLLQGRKEEGGRLAAEVLTDAKLLPRYLKREHGPWIRAAGRLKSGTERLPRPRFEGSQPPGYRLRIALGAAAALVVLALFAAYAWFQVSHGLWDHSRWVQEQAALHGRMQGLDRRYPWKGGDLSKLDLSEPDLDRYLAIRQSLAPVPRGAAFLRVLATGLEGQRMGPRQFAALTNLVDWRFLRRPEALIFGLPEFHRSDWLIARAALDQGLFPGEQDTPERQRWRELTQAKVADYERQAAAAIDLSPATRNLLESRRADLERLDSAQDGNLMSALDPTLPGPGLYEGTGGEPGPGSPWP